VGFNLYLYLIRLEPQKLKKFNEHLFVIHKGCKLKTQEGNLVVTGSNESIHGSWSYNSS
jgi:hypothetical protein